MMCVVLKKIYEYSGGNMGGDSLKIHMNGCGIDIKRIYGWEGGCG